MQAVQRIDYNITTRSDGSIDSIAAYVTIVNIPGDTKFLQQEFSTTFTDMTLSTSIAATRMRSGNPGYIFGAPTLAGRKSDDGTHVNVSVEGMTVGNVGKNGGDCLATSKSFVSTYFDYVYVESVPCRMYHHITTLNAWYKILGFLV